MSPPTRDISAALLHKLAIMAYWIPDPAEASNLMARQILARRMTYSHGNKMIHMQPCDIKPILMRLVEEGKEGFMEKGWAELANEALREK